MPDVGISSYILRIWNEVGECKSTGMGIVPIDWVDLEAYSSFNPINKWEAKCVIMLSKIYTHSVSRYAEDYMIAPYCSDPELAEDQRRQAQTERRRASMLAAVGKPQ